MYLILIIKSLSYYLHSVKHNILVETIFMLEDVLFLRRKCVAVLSTKKSCRFMPRVPQVKFAKKKTFAM